MRDLLNLIRWMLFRLFRSRTSLKVEVVISRHQLNMLHRRSPRPLVFSVLMVCSSCAFIRLPRAFSMH